MEQTKKHTHGETFRLMRYHGKKGLNEITLVIWNSRDGVTPFMTYCKEYGIELQHINWQNDLYMPDYKPKKGDLIWVSHTKETAIKAAEEMYHMHSEMLQKFHDEKVDRDEYSVNVLEKMVSDKKGYIDSVVNDMLFEHGEPQPHLLLVEEDWK